MSLKKICRVLLVSALVVTSVCITGCLGFDLNSDSQPNSDILNTAIDTNIIDSNINDSDTGDSNVNDGENDNADYYLLTVTENEHVVASPYVGNGSVPNELKGLYYSASEPGGAPKGDGTGKIWLILKPISTYTVQKVNVSGKYSSIESLGEDLYCIHGVESDLTVSVSTRTMLTAQREIFQDYGYGISDKGVMTVTWQENSEEPIRYVEVKYKKGDATRTEYIDASLGKIELFEMIPNEVYTVSLRAVGYKRIGKSVEIKGCYVREPKNIPFPRVEITTENFVWPSCDFVSSPEGCWGAGITNALYEQCVMVIYNENNEIIYTSSAENGLDGDFSGAKMKIRGNTSARYASNGRFPYKIKLNQKADLLEGLVDREYKSGYADKDWVLLNYGNDGYRIVGDAIADSVGTEYSPDYCYVTLYVNGEYRGLYVLSETVKDGNGVEEDSWRVSVDSDGYVFECDAYWWNEDFSFATPLTENTPMHFTLKYPDPDNITEDSEEVKYLKDYLTRFEEALMRDDESYLDYIDLDSFVKWLLVSDYLCINDGGGCNIFLYKKDATDETKICMGPNWDFDSYMGSVTGLSVIRLSWDTAPFYYQHLIKKESFQARYKELFVLTYQQLFADIENAFSKIDIEAHTRLLECDNKRFGTSTTTLITRKERFLDWLSQHLEWMESQFI